MVHVGNEADLSVYSSSDDLMTSPSSCTNFLGGPHFTAECAHPCTLISRVQSILRT
jgi:hypothetical protein